MSEPSFGDWLTPADVAAALKLAMSTVRLMIRDGRLPARRLRGSRLLRIARADLDVLLEPLPARPRFVRVKTAGP